MNWIQRIGASALLVSLCINYLVSADLPDKTVLARILKTEGNIVLIEQKPLHDTSRSRVTAGPGATEWSLMEMPNGGFQLVSKRNGTAPNWNTNTSPITQLKELGTALLKAPCPVEEMVVEKTPMAMGGQTYKLRQQIGQVSSVPLLDAWVGSDGALCSFVLHSYSAWNESQRSLAAKGPVVSESEASIIAINEAQSLSSSACEIDIATMKDYVRWEQNQDEKPRLMLYDKRGPLRLIWMFDLRPVVTGTLPPGVARALPPGISVNVNASDSKVDLVNMPAGTSATPGETNQELSETSVLPTAYILAVLSALLLLFLVVKLRKR